MNGLWKAQWPTAVVQVRLRFLSVLQHNGVGGNVSLDGGRSCAGIGYGARCVGSAAAARSADVWRACVATDVGFPDSQRSGTAGSFHACPFVVVLSKRLWFD